MGEFEYEKVDEIKNIIDNSDHIIVNWIDALRPEETCNMPFLLNKKEKGVYFDEAHTVAPYTSATIKTIFTGKRYLDDYFDRLVEIVVYVDKIKIVETKKREKMMFITGSDELTKLDIVVFPKIYKRFAEPQIGDILLVTGKVEKRFDQLQLSVTVIKKLNN